MAQIVRKNLPQGESVTLLEDTPTVEVHLPPSGKRVFSTAYKRRILDQLDACSHLGEKVALLRREGLYASYGARTLDRSALEADGGLPKRLLKVAKIQE